MAGLTRSVFAASVLDFHVHVDRPDIHPLRVVCDDAFEHRSTAFWLTVLVLKTAVFSDDVDVLRLGQSLQRSLQDRLGWRETVRIHPLSHFKQELEVAAPDLQVVVVLLAQSLEDVLDVLGLFALSVNVNQLQIDL